MLVKVAKFTIALLLTFLCRHEIARLKILPWIFLSLILYACIGNIGKAFNYELGVAVRYFPSFITYLFIVLSLASLNFDRTRSICENSIKIFSIFNLPSLVIWILVFIGIDLPYETKEFIAEGYASRIYYGVAVMPAWFNIEVAGFVGIRNGGMFKEPGFLGTFCAINLFISYLLGLNSRYNFILIALGITTFSMAFYIVLILFYIGLIFIKFNKKMIAPIISFSILVYFVIVYFFDILYTMILYRFGRSGKLFGVSRSSDYEQLVDFFTYASSVEKFFGLGFYGSISNYSMASVYEEIINVGIIGFGALLFVAFYLFIYKLGHLYRLTGMLVGCLVLLLNWQRPDFTSVPMMLFAAFILSYANSRVGVILAKEG